MATESDGRHLRRERSRQAVIDATLALILEGKGRPSAQDVANRAGVSESSLFRIFDSLADLDSQCYELFQARYSHLILARPLPGDDLPSRIDFFVRHRVSLCEQAGPLMMIARMRILEEESITAHVVQNRAELAAQTRECFRAELAARTTAGASELVSVLDSLTSPEVFELMTGTHRRSSRQVGQSWRSALRALLADGAADSTYPSIKRTR